MSDDDPLAPIIQLRPGQDTQDDARPLAMGPRPSPSCFHLRTELDGEARRVHCRDCGREVPAFDVLEELARSSERFIAHRREAQRRMKVAEGHLEDLLRDERNAKARRRHWAKHEPEAMRHLRAVLALFRHSELEVVVAARGFVGGRDDAVRP